MSVELKPKRGRPKTVSIDKKEYQKQYYQKHKDVLTEKHKEYYSEHKEEVLDKQKEYIEKLQVNNPDKYKELRTKQKDIISELHRKERAIYKLVKELYNSGLLSVPDSHKEIINNLVN